jgi:RNA polymerase-binding transcription factor DksA
MALNPTPSPFTPEQLAAWRGRLVVQARSLKADVAALDDEAVLQERVAPNHNLPESGSELQSAEIVGSAATDEQEELRLVLRALRKIDTAEPMPFGLCEVTGAPIERERLELMPWTPVCAEVGRQLERHGLSLEDALAPM